MNVEYTRRKLREDLFERVEVFSNGNMYLLVGQRETSTHYRLSYIVGYAGETKEDDWDMPIENVELTYCKFNPAEIELFKWIKKQVGNKTKVNERNRSQMILRLRSKAKSYRNAAVRYDELADELEKE